MTESVHIFDACRTPIGKSGGFRAEVRPDDLAAQVLMGLVERNGWLGPTEIDEVFWGPGQPGR